MFCKKTETGYQALARGVELKTLVHGEKTHMCEFRVAAGGTIPRHSHSHEQTGYLVSGRVDFHMGDNKLEARPGDCWCVPGDVEHWAETLEDSVIIEVFSPVRDDYLS
jgi:quercetin dioxygenase-like cupin family protein